VPPGHRACYGWIGDTHGCSKGETPVAHPISSAAVNTIRSPEPVRTGKPASREIREEQGENPDCPLSPDSLDRTFSRIAASEDSSLYEKALSRPALAITPENAGEKDAGLIKESLMLSLSHPIPGSVGSALISSALTAYEKAGKGDRSFRVLQEAFRVLEKAPFSTGTEKTCPAVSGLYFNCFDRILKARGVNEKQAALSREGMSATSGKSWHIETEADLKEVMEKRRHILETIRDTTAPEYPAREAITRSLESLQNPRDGGDPEKSVCVDEEVIVIGWIRLEKNMRLLT